MKKTVFAIAILMSTIVGVGLFGLPFAGAQSGFLIAAVFLFLLVGIMLFLHLMYGQIVLNTKGKHRSPGYAGIYLGKTAKKILSCSVVLGFYGSLLVYIIIGGNFLNVILSPFINIDPVVFNILFFIIGAIVIYFGLNLIAELDLVMGGFLILIIFLFFFLGVPKIDINNLKIVNWHNIFFPYGAILYSLSGMAAIPEIRELFKKKEKNYKKAIVFGTIIPAYLGSIFGFLACITSFFIIGLSLKKVFWYDFKIKKNLSWLLVCIIPLVLFLLGFRDFIFIIIVLGALLGGIEGTSIVLIYKKIRDSKTKSCFMIPNILMYIIIAIFAFGFIYTLISVVS